MALRTLAYFLALSASFFLFYFNVPYWTGRDMADLSSSGIWRAFFRFLSFLGYGLYRLCELLCRGIQQPVLNLVRNRSPRVLNTIAKLINILFYIVILFLLTTVYAGFMDYLFPPAVQTIGDGSGGTLFGLLSEIVVVLRIFANTKRGQTMVVTVIVFIIAVILYIIINTLFFSILYGLLRNKLREVDLTKRVPFLKKKEEPKKVSGPWKSNDLEEPAEKKPIQELGGQFMDSVREFLGKQTQINSLRKNPVLLVLLLLVFLAFSFFMTSIGQDNLTILDVVWQVLDAVQIIPIVGSFIITYWIDRGAVKAGQVAVAHMPEGIQMAVHAASARGNQWADAQDSKRAAWATAHDIDISDPDEPAPPPSAQPQPPMRKSPVPPASPAVEPLDTTQKCPYREYCPECDRADQLGGEVFCQDARYKNCTYYKSIKKSIT